MGLLDNNASYRAEYGHSFDRLARPLPGYDETIAVDAGNAVRVNAERIYSAKLDSQKIIKAVKHLVRLFFQAVVEETWLLPLKHATSFFNKVTLRQLLNQITLGSGGLDTTDIVSLIKQMMEFWNADTSTR